MSHALLLSLCCSVAAALRQSVPEVPARLAALGPEGLVVCEGTQRTRILRTAGIATFAWDRGGRAVLATQGGELFRIELASGRRTLLRRCRELRFPDAAPRSGRIAIAFLADATQESRWRVGWMQPDGSDFVDLGDGYDPCWSHDERELWFEDFDEHGPALYALRIETGQRRRLVEDSIPRHTVDRAPEPGALAWSSQRHLHAGVPGAPGECFSSGADYDRFASFSPSGDHLLFFREDARGHGGIVLRERVSGAERMLELEGRIDLAAFAPSAPPSRTIEDFSGLSRSASASRELHASARLDAERYAARLRVLQRDLAEEPCALLLPGVTTLDPYEAALLVTSGASQIVLPDLLVLDQPTARALARWSTNAEQAFLALDGLRDADPQVLRELASLRGWGLSLGGLVRLTTGQAAALAELRVGWLDLRGVREVDMPVARALLGGSLKFVDLRGLERMGEGARALFSAAGQSVLLPRS